MYMYSYMFLKKLLLPVILFVLKCLQIFKYCFLFLTINEQLRDIYMYLICAIIISYSTCNLQQCNIKIRIKYPGLLSIGLNLQYTCCTCTCNYKYIYNLVSCTCTCKWTCAGATTDQLITINFNRDYQDIQNISHPQYMYVVGFQTWK